MNALKRYQRSIRARSHSGLDLLLILLSFVIVHFLYLGDLDMSTERLIVLVASLGLSYGAFSAAGLYRTDRMLLLHVIMSRLSIGWFLVVLSVVLLTFMLKVSGDISRVWFGLSSVLAYVSLLAARIASGLVLVLWQKKGSASVSVVLVGEHSRTEALTERLYSYSWSGYEFIKVFDSVTSEALALQQTAAPADQTLTENINSVDHMLDEVVQFVEQQRKTGRPVAEVWVALPLAAEESIKSLIAKLRDSSVDVCLVPDTFAMQLVTGAALSVADVPVINISDVRLSGAAELFKKLFDFVLSSLAVLFLLPIYLVIAVLIKIDSSGPVFFRQHRYGMDGQEIEVWKFRSMKVQENGSSVTQATKNDARVTKIGAFLRKHSLDELPQFINVLQGNMSIVGPRPHAVTHNEEYRVQIDGYMMRHKIKPGITGWAQVNGWRGETDTLDKMQGRVHYDLEYIRNWSPWLDMKIILLTVTQVFTGKDVY